MTSERAAVEACLALGGTRYQALLPIIRDALRSGFMPTINGIAAIGLVSLPGMMTGQILAGVEPTDAVKYQLLIMFLIAGGPGNAGRRHRRRTSAHGSSALLAPGSDRWRCRRGKIAINSSKDDRMEVANINVADLWCCDRNDFGRVTAVGGLIAYPILQPGWMVH